MKQYLCGVIVGVSCLAACNTNAINHPDATATIALPGNETAGKPAAGVKTDPVCGMEKDSTWTDYTLINADTVWFCSNTEKETFLANPQKYEANLGK
jgi:YHS domain-containing protein